MKELSCDNAHFVHKLMQEQFLFFTRHSPANRILGDSSFTIIHLSPATSESLFRDAVNIIIAYITHDSYSINYSIRLAFVEFACQSSPRNVETDRFTTYSTFDMLNFQSPLSRKQSIFLPCIPVSWNFRSSSNSPCRVVFSLSLLLSPSRLASHSFAILLRVLIHLYLCSLFYPFLNLAESPTARCIQQIRLLSPRLFLPSTQRRRLITSRLGLNC